MSIKKFFVDVHQPTLADRRQHLFERNALCLFRQAQFLPSAGNGARGDDDHLYTLMVESGNLVDEVSHALHIQTGGARSQQARAELGDNAVVGNVITFRFLLAHF